MRTILVLLFCCSVWAGGVVGRPAAQANDYVTQPEIALKAATEQANTTRETGSGSVLAWASGALALLVAGVKLYTGSAPKLAEMAFRALSNKKERGQRVEEKERIAAGERAIKAIEELPNDTARDKAVHKVMSQVPDGLKGAISSFL